jgi:ADP-ribosylglycohydrolase
MTNPSLEERLRGGLVGLLIGDSLGVPYEFNPPEAIPLPELIDMNPPPGFGRSYPSVPVGTWSDDGAQGLCLLESLLAKGELDAQDLGTRLLSWLDTGHLMPDGDVFDCGIQTRQALERLRRGTPPSRSGGAGERDNGNGALMRALPLALWHRGDDRQLIRDSHRQSVLTHAHPRSQVCCALYCLWARQMLMHEQSDGWEEAVAQLESLYQERMDDSPGADYASELRLVLNYPGRKSPSGSGYVVDTLWSSRRALEQDTFESVVRAAIALGNDTDTTACVAGGLAGIRHGFEGIPERWRSQLRGDALFRPLLDGLLMRMADLLNPSRRVMEMFAALMDMGYQKLRFFPFVGPAGAWRFIITVEDTPRRENSPTAVYQSPGWDHTGLGWGECSWEDPKQLAAKFLSKFPQLAELGLGDDPEYSSWYREAMRKAPPGKSFALWWDGEEPVDHVLIEHDDGTGERIPFPPGWAA